MDEYYSRWEDERLETLTSAIKLQIYEKYLVKSEVFQRDNFTCQMEECKNPEAKLTMHHVKWQKNGGENKTRNCITLCNTCHKGFHAGKYPLIVKDNPALPSHIRGHTFKLDVNDEVNWKIIKKEMKRFRKGVHDRAGLRISWEQIAYLMKWLETIYQEDIDYDSFEDE